MDASLDNTCKGRLLCLRWLGALRELYQGLEYCEGSAKGFARVGRTITERCDDVAHTDSPWFVKLWVKGGGCDRIEEREGVRGRTPPCRMSFVEGSTDLIKKERIVQWGEDHGTSLLYIKLRRT